MFKARPHRSAGPEAQRGAVAIIVGLTMAVLVGFAGLAIDGGRLYLTKTELQNAADACALAASYELTGSPIPAEAFTRADAAARTVATKNRVGFQGTAIAGSQVTLTYNDDLVGSWSSAAAAGGTAKYVRCNIEQTGIQPYLMQVLGIGEQTVGAFATATLAPAQSNCAVPMAICSKPGGSAPNYGYTTGEWVPMNFDATGGGGGGGGNGNGNGNNSNESVNYTGNFRWVDFNPNATTPGCGGNGASELSCVIAGTGQCSLPPPVAASTACGSGSNVTPGCVGQNGQVASLEQAFNTRFGLYKGSYNIGSAPPDFTGFAYTNATWTNGSNAYSDFESKRNAFTQVQSSYTGGGYSRASSTEYQTLGADRRVVTIPIVNCPSFSGGSSYAPVVGYACMLLLDPYTKSGNTVTSKLEYLGRSNVAGSPCASSGIAGDASSQGPLVPALVQ